MNHIRPFFASAAYLAQNSSKYIYAYRGRVCGSSVSRIWDGQNMLFCDENLPVRRLDLEISLMLTKSRLGGTSSAPLSISTILNVLQFCLRFIESADGISRLSKMGYAILSDAPKLYLLI